MREINKIILDEAKILGAAARLSDKERSPANDELLLTLLDEIDISHTQPILLGWLEGWDHINQIKN